MFPPSIVKMDIKPIEASTSYWVELEYDNDYCESMIVTEDGQVCSMFGYPKEKLDSES